MSLAFNYKHLYYFWTVAKEGGMSRAAERLNLAVQTISAQVRELEHDLGCQLLKPAGRGLALTDAGVAALRQAEHIFQLGEALPDVVRVAAQNHAVRLAVGIADGLPKLVVQRLLQPVLGTPDLRLLCHEGEMPDLLADLALHRLDVVLADHPAPFNPHLKVHSHPLGTSGMGWYAPPQWWQVAQQQDGGFPEQLSQLPVLLPTAHSSVRARLDAWLNQHHLRPRVAGEFEDSALLETFGGSGLGVFPAALAVRADLEQRLQARLLGMCDGVEEHYYAISTERKVGHPLVQQLLQATTALIETSIHQHPHAQAPEKA